MAKRRCGRCKQVVRRDDPLDIRQCDVLTAATDGMTHVMATVTAMTCRACLGQRAPLYEPGNAPCSICGICCRALYEDDEGQPMRLWPGDIHEEDPAPGCYMSCRECVARYRPRIWERLVAEGVRTGPMPETFGGDWLL